YGSTVLGIGNANVVGVKPGDVLGNPLLVWEKTQTTNLALDMSFLKNRVNVTADFYNNESKNVLLEVAIPTSPGSKELFRNIDSLRNRGLEVTITTLNVSKADFQWKSALNITLNRSNINSLYTGSANDYMLTSYESRISFYTDVDGPVSSLYGFK